jgi:hypothetical protein
MTGVLSTGIYDQNLNLLMSFDTYIQNNFHNTNNVAYEPLENGTYSSDSKQNSPFLVSITGVKVINSNTNNPTISVDQLNQRLVILLQSTQLVTLVLQPMIVQANQSSSKFAQYGNIYRNLSLVSLDYENTADQLEFRPVMTFQEIRLTNTAYTNSQNVANPDNTATLNHGQVQTTTGTPQDNSALNYIFTNVSAAFGGG